MSSRILTLFVLLLSAMPVSATLSVPSSSGGSKVRVFLSREEALQLAFPKCEIKKSSFYLSKEQRARAKKLSHGKQERNVVHAYEARKNGKLVGTAYFDAHKVRTHKEVLMIIVGKERAIERIELLSFAEPIDYIPRGNWYAQFIGKKLDENLSLKRDIRGVSGATLTARATTSAARRVLALHTVVVDAKSKPKSKAD